MGGELQVESVTNHDVKAIEYVIKERIGHNPELAKVSTRTTSGLSCGLIQWFLHLLDNDAAAWPAFCCAVFRCKFTW